MFRVVSEAVGGRRVKLPLDENWDVPRVAARVGARPVGRVVWLCNPNNPTGRLLHAEVRAVLEAAPDAIVALDEAYDEISGHSLAPMFGSNERRAHPDVLKGNTDWAGRELGISSDIPM